MTGMGPTAVCLIQQGEEIGRIVEKPWRNNIKKDSCIPEGHLSVRILPSRETLLS